MAVSILRKENEPAVNVLDWASAESVLQGAHDEAANAGIFAFVTLKSDDGYEFGIAVGGDRSVLSYQSADGEPPYMASLGTAMMHSEVFTAYAWFAHHTEFPGDYAIPRDQALKAARQFVDGERPPEAVVWQMV